MHPSDNVEGHNLNSRSIPANDGILQRPRCARNDTVMHSFCDPPTILDRYLIKNGLDSDACRKFFV